MASYTAMTVLRRSAALRLSFGLAIIAALTVHRAASQEPSAAPSGATARCRDGTYSFSKHRSGTCSHHGGVATWLTPDAANDPPRSDETARAIAPALQACGGACGVERWAVKTLGDPDHERVRLAKAVN